MDGSGWMNNDNPLCSQKYFCFTSLTSFKSREECSLDCPACSLKVSTYKDTEGNIKVNCRGLPLIRFKIPLVQSEVQEWKRGRWKPQDSFAAYPRVCQKLFHRQSIPELLLPQNAFYDEQSDRQEWKQATNQKQSANNPLKFEPSTDGLKCLLINSSKHWSKEEVWWMGPYLREPIKETEVVWEENLRCGIYRNGRLQSNSEGPSEKTIKNYYIADTARIDNHTGKPMTYFFKGLPHMCHNSFRIPTKRNDKDDKCQRLSYSTDPSLVSEKHGLSIMEGNRMGQWPTLLRISMNFPRFWSSRSIADRKYKDINYFDLRNIVEKASKEYLKSTPEKHTGIVIHGHLVFRCSIFAEYCKYESPVWNRIDDRFPGFSLTRYIYQSKQALSNPGLEKYLKTHESRIVQQMHGIRVLITVDATMQAPDPMAFLIQLGALGGLMGLSKTLTDLIVQKVLKKSQFTRMEYAPMVELEKNQIYRCFQRAISEEMQVLYEREQTLKKLFKDD